MWFEITTKQMDQAFLEVRKLLNSVGMYHSFSIKTEKPDDFRHRFEISFVIEYLKISRWIPNLIFCEIIHRSILKVCS